MRKVHAILMLAATFALSGCATYQYRIGKPAAGMPPVLNRPVSLHYDPLDYEFSRYEGHLAVRITNPTGDRIVMQGNRSYVVGPEGESHPIRGRTLGPHSYTRLFLPPIPLRYLVPDYYAWGPAWGGWGPGAGWGWYDPFWGPYYGGFYPYPPMTTYTIRTTYDWVWKEGPAQLRFSYDRGGKTFEHDFEILREKVK